MAVLNHKLFRDLRHSAGLLATIVAIIAVGTGAFIGMGSSHRILVRSQHAYYRDYHFADFWVNVKKAPLPAADQVAAIPGVAAVRPRVVFDIMIELPNEIQPLTGRLISTPARGFADVMNGICLMRGSGFSENRDSEAIVSEQFAAHHGLEPGDRIEALLNRRRESFVIVGTAISPEYVYMVRGEGDFVPDPGHFGIMYIKEDYARELLDFEGAFNQLSGTVAVRRDADHEFLLQRIGRELDAFGVLTTTPRSRQASHRFLSDEIQGLGAVAVVMPAIFLLVAALVLNILMTRMAKRQRTIIGSLKALGYANRQVMVHFLSFGLVVGLIGGIAGIACGLYLTGAMLGMYTEFFQFPAFPFTYEFDLYIEGLAISVFFAAAGTAKGVWSVLKLAPAEAMRPPPPERGGKMFLERLPFVWRSLGFRTHMALRSLARNRARTLTALLSSALATSIIVMALVMYDSMFFLIDFQFEHITRSDADIGMQDERSLSAWYEARRLPGVDHAEPMLSVVCDVTHGRATRRIAILGLIENHQLTTPITTDLQPIDVPPNGLVFTEALASVLGVRMGESVRIRPVRGRREVIHAPVVAVADSYLGLSCYASLHYLSGLIGEAEAVNGLQLTLDASRTNDLYHAIRELPNARNLSLIRQTKTNIENTFMESMGASLGTMLIFAGVIALGSMINTSMVEIADRTRDIATMRVLGYRAPQIAGVFFRQNLILFILGLCVSAPVSYGMVTLMARAYDMELFRMPVRWNAGTLLGAGAISFVFVMIAQGVVYRAVQRLDWAEGIKVKE